jgi:fructose-1,6-bisphosphatase/inositol monophosphatase family enzyme
VAAGDETMEKIRFRDVHNHCAVEYEASWEGGKLAAIRRAYDNECGWEDIPTWAAHYPELERKAKFHKALSVGRYAHLFRATITALENSVCSITKWAQECPDYYFSPEWLGPQHKPILRIDRLAQEYATSQIGELLPKNRDKRLDPGIIGEETLHEGTLDLSDFDRPVLVLDVVDGTDELEQGTDLWCSAATIYFPPEDRILASFVAIPGKRIYFAMEDSVGMYRRHDDSPRHEVSDLQRLSDVKCLSESLVACYGHNGRRLDNMCDHQGYRELLARLDGSRRGRVRMVGGNPWIIRMIDSLGRRRPDGVFDLFGQAPHHMVPAAHIAVKCGAVLLGKDGKPIDMPSLLRLPKSPVSQMPYILASTPELAHEIRGCLFGERQTTSRPMMKRHQAMESAVAHNV